MAALLKYVRTEINQDELMLLHFLRQVYLSEVFKLWRVRLYLPLSNEESSKVPGNSVQYRKLLLWGFIRMRFLNPTPEEKARSPQRQQESGQNQG